MASECIHLASRRWRVTTKVSVSQSVRQSEGVRCPTWLRGGWHQLCTIMLSSTRARSLESILLAPFQQVGDPSLPPAGLKDKERKEPIDWRRACNISRMAWQTRAVAVVTFSQILRQHVCSLHYRANEFSVADSVGRHKRPLIDEALHSFSR